MYKQLGDVGLKLYRIIEDKERDPICPKAEENLVAVHCSLISLYDPAVSETLKAAQEAEHKVNEAIGKLESHYDSQLFQRD